MSSSHTQHVLMPCQQNVDGRAVIDEKGFVLRARTIPLVLRTSYELVEGVSSHRIKPPFVVAPRIGYGLLEP